MISAVILDLDGTLLDTLDDLADSMNEALEVLHCPTHPREAYRHFVGDGIHVLVQRTLPEGRRDQETVHRATELYRAAYGRNWKRKSQPYEGIMEALPALRSAGLRLTVLSNKPHPFTRLVMQHFFPAEWFEVIFGQRPEVPRKPDPAGALEIAQMLELDSASVAFIGDTRTDMETGRAAQMRTIGVSWGFRPVSELEESGASAVVHHPREMLSVLL